jgi:hypothetical protein
MRQRLRLLLAASALLSGGAALHAKPEQRPFPEGIYGNVSMSRVTGDLGGFEVRFFTDPVTAKPMAEFTLCEGWCNSVDIAEVTRTEEGFAFAHLETLEGYDDNGTLREESHLVEYQVIPAGKGWKVRLFYDGNDITAGETWRIKPLKQPFGLITARIESSDDAER